MADATSASAAAAAASVSAEEEDPSVWASVSKALTSYKDVEVRNWTRELVIDEQALDERLWRCHPLTELRLTIPRMDTNLGGVGFLKNLVTLVVRDCGLSELPRSLARCQALKNLDASYNPDLTYLPEELCGLPHLDAVRATHCAIATIRDLEGCRRVSQLFLNHNLLTELDGPTFGSLTHLIHFEAAENAIDAIPAEIEQLAKTLQVLDLNDNFITAIPMAMGKLKKLVRVNLGGNEIADKQMLRVAKAATVEGAKKLKNFVTYCKKKGAKTKPASTKRPKFVRVTKAERLAAEQAAAEAAAAAAEAAAAAAATVEVVDSSGGEGKAGDAGGADGWGAGAGDADADAGEWGAGEGSAGGGEKGGPAPPQNFVEEARAARLAALLQKRREAAAATEEGRRALEEDAGRVEKQRAAERDAALEKQKADAEVEAALEEKRRLEEEAEEAAFAALPEEEQQRILAARAAEAAKEEADRLALLAEAKAKRDAIAAREAAREAAKAAELQKERAEAMAAQQAVVDGKLAANKRYTGIVLKFDKAKRFGFIKDEASGRKLFVHIDMLMHEAQSVSVQAHKRTTLDVGVTVEYNIEEPRGRQPLGKATSVSLPGFKPFPRVFS